MSQPYNNEAKELGSLLLDVGIYLLGSGDSCCRIKITMLRLVISSNYTVQISIAPKSFSLNLNDEDDNAFFSGMRTILAQGVNFKAISGISRLSCEAVEKHFTIQQVPRGNKKPEF